jgi:hypothetical protein
VEAAVRGLKGEVYEGPGGILLQIDIADADTPALVWSADRAFSSTYECAMATGVLDCGAGPDLTREQLEWLDQYEDEVNEAFDVARKDDPRFR